MHEAEPAVPKSPALTIQGQSDHLAPPIPLFIVGYLISVLLFVTQKLPQIVNMIPQMTASYTDLPILQRQIFLSSTPP
jgi:hypothetical protein